MPFHNKDKMICYFASLFLKDNACNSFKTVTTVTIPKKKRFTDLYFYFPKLRDEVNEDYIARK